MDSTKYIGMDVHKETVSIAVSNSAGKLVVESIIETKAATILQFIQGLRGNLHFQLRGKYFSLDIPLYRTSEGNIAYREWANENRVQTKHQFWTSLIESSNRKVIAMGA